MLHYNLPVALMIGLANIPQIDDTRSCQYPLLYVYIV